MENNSLGRRRGSRRNLKGRQELSVLKTKAEAGAMMRGTRVHAGGKTTRPGTRLGQSLRQKTIVKDASRFCAMHSWV